MQSVQAAGATGPDRTAAHAPRQDTLRECPDCGLLQTLPPLGRGGVAVCRRCDAVLRRARSEPFLRSLALGLSGLILFSIAATGPFLSLELLGQTWTATLPALPAALERFGVWELSVAVAATTLLAPLVRLCLTVAVLAVLRRPGEAPDWLPAAARWRERLGPWSMVEVFLLGAFVAYTRLTPIATVHVGPALWALGGLMLVTVASDALLDRDAMWEEIGRRRAARRPPDPSPAEAPPIGCHECGRVSRAALGRPCPCCGTPLHARKPNSLARSWAFLLSAAALYVPANLYPVMTVVRFGQGHPSTILGGVGELIEAQMWPLALLVFVASVLVPLLKLIGLATLLIATGRGSTRRLVDRARLYRVIEVIGRWSMIDIFMLAILVALVRMGFVATVLPDPGAIFFASVVVLTMLASIAFDPRLMWDAVGPASRGTARGRSG